MTKSEFRSKSLSTLRAIGKSKARWYDHHIVQELWRLVREAHATSIMLYVPLGLEPDIMPLIATLRKYGMRVYVPFMEGESFRLVQYRLPLKIKKYGVREPNNSYKYRARKIDIAIVPIVGTDRKHRRIGFGKGMYDRFFANEKNNIGHIVFVQRRLMCYPGIVSDPWDIVADEIICASL